MRLSCSLNFGLNPGDLFSSVKQFVVVKFLTEMLCKKRNVTQFLDQPRICLTNRHELVSVCSLAIQHPRTACLMQPELLSTLSKPAIIAEKKSLKTTYLF